MALKGTKFNNYSVELKLKTKVIGLRSHQSGCKQT